MDPGQDIGVRLARGDDDALEECYALYGSSVLAYLRRLVGRDEAEDVLQRTFLDLWRHADRYDPAQSFSGWLFTIAHRRAVDHLRGRRPTVIPVEVLREVMGDDGRETAERFAWAADVRAALTQLPQEQRETIEMAYFGDRTQREISLELAVPLGTVKARMARGTRALGTLLRARGATPGGTSRGRGGP